MVAPYRVQLAVTTRGSRLSLSSAVPFGGWQEGHSVISNPHFPVALAARATKPGPLHRRNLRRCTAAGVGRNQAAAPSAGHVWTRHRKAAQHGSILLTVRRRIANGPPAPVIADMIHSERGSWTCGWRFACAAWRVVVPRRVSRNACAGATPW